MRTLSVDHVPRRLQSRQVIGKTSEFVDSQVTQQHAMRGRHVGAALFQRVMQLAQEITIVLSGEARHLQDAIALAIDTVAGQAIARVEALSQRDVAAITYAWLRRARQGSDVTGKVRNLAGTEIVAPDHFLHLHVPAIGVPVIDQLLRNHALVLLGDHRHIALGRSIAVTAVTGDAGGKQFRVEKGAKVRVPSLNGEVGSSVELDVLATAEKIGAPIVDGAKVTATVVDHGRDTKIIVFKKKRRKQYKRTKGHRQGFTTLKIDSIA